MSIKKRSSSHGRPKKTGIKDQKKKLDASKDRVINQSKKHPTHIKRKTVRVLEVKQIRIKKRRLVRMKRTFVEFGISLAILGIFLYLLSFFTLSFTKVAGYSMVPTLNNDEWVLVNKLVNPKRFKLVVHRDSTSKETSVRRVIGLPGEAIHYKDDTLYVNDHDVYERFIAAEVQRAKSSKGEYTADWTPETEIIPKGKYLLLGDNRPYAADSREYGYVDEKEIVGVVEMRVLPLHLIQQF
ncbi:signal peptidase I [Enterococcus sp. 7F3_DIV0205]|uniref:Signal peptidase I n=1 Tax=Candidatus Enterococcus palustris TaxID=1834189 RepID=A0AAQ3Y6I0_9ENTE|nr:signal peptidase I [Enterococcus sp. 7F3_DIV0205]OTN82627.1 signal peptidase I [Enterococcus sp. 7F3_DIV0205]